MMIDVILKRYLPDEDVATKVVAMPYAPFKGLTIMTGPEGLGYTGRFIVDEIVFDGVTTVREKPAIWYPGEQPYKKPTEAWIKERQAKFNAARDARIEEYKSAGWDVEKSENLTDLKYFYVERR